MKKEQRKELEPKIQMHIDAQERNYFKDEHERRYKVERRSRILVILAVLTVAVFFLTIVLPNGLDSNNVHLSLAWWVDTLRGNFEDLARFLGPEKAEYMSVIIYRFIVVGLVGAALAISGTVFQGSMKNGLASPTTLGVQSGGVAGGSIYVLFFMTESTGLITSAEITQQKAAMNLFERYAPSFFILAGCFIAVIFVLTVARIAGRGKVSSIALILTGMIFGSVVSGITGLVQYWLMLFDSYGERTYQLRFMMMGTFSRIVTLEEMLLVCVPVAAGLILLLGLSPRLNLLVFGEEDARAMGIRVEFTRNLMVAICTIITAIVISFCGSIGFVGFFIPHLARRITGPDFRWLMPASAMTGAIFLMIIYYIATCVNYADNINFMTSLIGGIAVLIMLIRYRRKSNADWA